MAEVKKPVAVAKKAEEVKTEAAVETKAAAAKKTAKKAAAPKKEAAPKAVKKEAAPKAAAPKKEAAPKAVKKEAAPKAADVVVKIQFNDKEVDLDWVKAEVVKKAGNGAVAYLVVNDNKVYCTVDGEAKGDFEV